MDLQLEIENNILKLLIEKVDSELDKYLYLENQYKNTLKEGDALLIIKEDSSNYRQESRRIIRDGSQYKERSDRLAYGRAHIKFTGGITENGVNIAKERANKIYNNIQGINSYKAIIKKIVINNCNLEINIYNTLNNISRYTYAVEREAKIGYIVAFRYKYKLLNYKDIVSDTITSINVIIKADDN